MYTFPPLMLLLSLRRYAPVVKRPMSGKRQYMSALDNGYEEMAAQNRRDKAKEQQSATPAAGNSSLVNHFPNPDDTATLNATLSLVEEEGTLNTDGSTTLKVKKQNGTEVVSHELAHSYYCVDIS